MRRAVATISLVSALVTIFGPTSLVGARPPIREHFGVEEFSFVIEEGICDFAVLVEVRQRFHLILLVNRAGEVVGGHTTGYLVARLTNLDTDRTIRRVIPGPAFLNAEGELVRGTGPWAFIFTVDGQVVNAWGHMEFEDGLVVSIRGRTEPFCGALS